MDDVKGKGAATQPGRRKRNNARNVQGKGAFSTKGAAKSALDFVTSDAVTAALKDAVRSSMLATVPEMAPLTELAIRGGSKLAKKGVDVFRKTFGLGDYGQMLPFDPTEMNRGGVSLKANSLFTSGRGPAEPIFTAGGKPKSVVNFAHKLTDVTMPSTSGEAGATYTTFALQPGLYTSIGLSAAKFKAAARYKLLGGAIVYRPTYSAGTKNDLGTVGIGIQYNVAGATRDTYAEFQALAPMRDSAAISDGKGFMVGVECDPTLLYGSYEDGFLVRTAALSTGSLNDYDWANVVMEKVAGADTTSAKTGELWWFGTAVATQDDSIGVVEGQLIASLGGTPSGTNPLGSSAPTYKIRNGVLADTTIDYSTKTITFGTCCRSVNLKLTFRYVGTSATIAAWGTTLTGCTELNFVWNGTAWGTTGGSTPVNGVASTAYQRDYAIRCDTSTATMALGTGGTIPTSATIAQVEITAYGVGLGEGE